MAPGDPRLHAFSLVGPMVVAMFFRECLRRGLSRPVCRLADQQARTALHGLLRPTDGEADERRTK